MKELESLRLECDGLLMEVFPAIRQGEIYWNSYAAFVSDPHEWVVNGGQRHPTREAGLYGLMSAIAVAANQFKAGYEKLFAQLDVEYRKQALRAVEPKAADELMLDTAMDSALGPPLLNESPTVGKTESMVEPWAITMVIRAEETSFRHTLTCNFRLNQIITNVEAPCQCTLTGIYTGTEENQILGPLDLYLLSTHHLKEMEHDFLKEHGLLGKTENEIDAYCDEQDLTMPRLMTLDLPTMKKGDSLSITGQFNTVCMIRWVGHASRG